MFLLLYMVDCTKFSLVWGYSCVYLFISCIFDRTWLTLIFLLVWSSLRLAPISIQFAANIFYQLAFTCIWRYLLNPHCWVNGVVCLQKDCNLNYKVQKSSFFFPWTVSSVCLVYDYPKVCFSVPLLVVESSSVLQTPICILSFFFESVTLKALCE